MEQVRNKAKQDFVRVDRTKAAPDGYTVGLGGIAGNVLAIGSYAKLPYDPRGDFTDRCRDQAMLSRSGARGRGR